MSLIRRIQRHFAVDRTVLAGLLLRAWQIPAGFVSVLLVVRCMSPEVQGYYYTYANLMAFQSVLELGLWVVLLNHTSHLWAGLRLEEGRLPTGDPEALSKLSSLVRLAAVWYGILAAIFVVGLGLFGLHFLRSGAVPASQWRGPWLGIIFCNGLMFAAMPFLTILEGCGQVAEVQWARFVQGIAGSLVLWIGLLLGWELWASASVGLTFVARDLWLIGVRWRRFFGVLLRRPEGPKVDWGRDMLPMQWKMALQGLLAYAGHSIFTPLMFKTHGAVVAGQTGMTLQIVAVITLTGYAWTQARAPLLGRCVATGDRTRLRSEWLALLRASTSAVILLIVMAIATLVFLQVYVPKLGGRFLSIGPSTIFLAASLAVHLAMVMNAFLRAHKEEPTFLVGAITSIVSGVAICVFGARYGPAGAAWAYLAILYGFLLPASVRIFNRYW